MKTGMTRSIISIKSKLKKPEGQINIDKNRMTTQILFEIRDKFALNGLVTDYFKSTKLCI